MFRFFIVLLIGFIFGWFSHIFLSKPQIINRVIEVDNKNTHKNSIIKLNKTTKSNQSSFKNDDYSTKNLIKKASVLFKNKKYLQALTPIIDVMGQVQDIYPEDEIEKTFLNIIKAHLQENNTTIYKINFLNKMLEVNPNNLELRFLISSELVKVKNYNEALYQISFLANNLDWKNKFDKVNQQIKYAKIFTSGDKVIPLIKKSNAWHIKVFVDSKPAILILDTGATITTIADNFVNNNSQGNLTINTANGSIIASKNTIDVFKVGDIIQENFSVVSLPSDKLPPNIDGLLGLDWLGEFNFVIDAKNHNLQLMQK
jgi:predicted aspartyl protease